MDDWAGRTDAGTSWVGAAGRMRRPVNYVDDNENKEVLESVTKHENERFF
jgi:hypothetical protein